MPKLKWVFLVAVLLGGAGMLGWAAAHRPGNGPRAVSTHPLAGGVWITAQISPDQLAVLRQQGFAAVVDLRPDGEAAGQPASGAVSRAAAAQGLAFHYIPVPHGDIPSTAVTDLGQVLATSKRPLLLYCHSGRRAARTWALAEASRADGIGAAAIELAVREAGQSADDLGPLIATRIAAREPASMRGAHR